MSLYAQESYDDMAFEREMKAAHQELLDAAATIDDSPMVVGSPPTERYESSQFRRIGGFDTTIPTTFIPKATAMRGAGVQGLFMPKEQPELLPFTMNAKYSMHVEHSSRSFGSGTNLRLQGHTHVAPKQVEPPSGSYKTWKPSHVVSKPTNGIMEAVIEGGYRSTIPVPVTTPRIEMTTLPRPKVARKKTSTPKASPTHTGRFFCPHNCGVVCKSQGDMARHLQSSVHQAPSVPCPKGCPKFFTRADAAGRHAKSGCPQARGLRK